MLVSIIRYTCERLCYALYAFVLIDGAKILSSFSLHRQQLESFTGPCSVPASARPAVGHILGLLFRFVLLLFLANRHLCFLQQSLYFTGTCENDTPECVSTELGSSLVTGMIVSPPAVLPVVPVSAPSAHPSPQPVSLSGAGTAAPLVCCTGKNSSDIVL